MNNVSGGQHRYCKLSLAVAVLALASPLWAQTSPVTAMDDRWHFAVAPYAWFAGVSGTFGPFEAPVEASFSDIVKNLDIAVLGHLEARRNRVGVVVDINYLNLSANVPTEAPILGQLDLTADMQSFMGEGVFFYRAVTGRDNAAFLDLLGGVRVTDTSTTLTVTGPQGGSLTGSEQKLGWVDGLVGIRFRVPLGSPRFGLEGRADVAGFGSDITWNLLGGLDVSVGKHWALGAGYRHMHVDYDEGRGLDRKVFKEAFHGPGLWAAYSW